MDVLEEFLYKYSYKFNKGYPNINDSQDKLLLESILKELGITLNENQSLISAIKKSNSFKDFGNLETSGKSTIKFTFSNIPNRGIQSDSMRKEAYDALEELVNNTENFTDYKRLKSGSSIGSAEVKVDDKKYIIIFKGAAEESKGDTDVKEALVSLFYYSNINSPFTKENYTERITQLIPLAENGISGESDQSSQKIIKYLTSISENNTTPNISFINQPLSSALTIKERYPGQKLIRTGLFNQIRNKALSLTGLPPDKWNPGDLYIQLGNVDDIESIDNIELINDLFNDEWGDDLRPLVSISLKQEKAQGGKAKALLTKFSKVKEDYNLSEDEINYDEQKYISGVKRLRQSIQNFVSSNENIEYDIKGDNLKSDIRFLRGKYAALKSIEFLFRQFGKDETDEALVALVGFALSLSGINPTFFQITGKSNGGIGHIDKFDRGQNIILYNVDGDYDPIKIEDSESFGGLKINFKIEKGGKPYLVSINARNNGNTQGTLEIQNIKPIS